MAKRSGIMLATPFTWKRLRSWCQSMVYVQPKLNGMRARWDGQNLISSQGNIIESAPYITNFLRTRDLPALDGELYCHTMPFQQIMSIAKRTAAHLHPHHIYLTYRVFDIIEPGMLQNERGSLITALAYKQDLFNACQAIHSVPTKYIPAARSALNEALAQYISDGYEGIIIRNPDGQYVKKRSPDLLKFKPLWTAAYRINYGEEEVSKDGIPKDALGSLNCSTPTGQCFNVGTGPALTRIAREQLWKQGGYKGMYAIINYPEVTVREVPSHPSLQGFRSTPLEPTRLTEMPHEG